MRFTIMITGIVAAATTAHAMAIPRPWIPNDVSDYRIHDDDKVHPDHGIKIVERPNNPDIQDKYPCWGCKRGETADDARDPSAMSVMIIDQGIIESKIEERTNNPNIQDQYPCWGCKREDTVTLLFTLLSRLRTRSVAKSTASEAGGSSN